MTFGCLACCLFNPDCPASVFLTHRTAPCLHSIQYSCFCESEDTAIHLAASSAPDALDALWGDKNTVLHLASFNGLDLAVATLLDLGARSFVRNKHHFIPIDCAADDRTRNSFFIQRDVLQEINTKLLSNSPVLSAIPQNLLVAIGQDSPLPPFKLVPSAMDVSSAAAATGMASAGSATGSPSLSQQGGSYASIPSNSNTKERGSAPSPPPNREFRRSLSPIRLELKNAGLGEQLLPLSPTSDNADLPRVMQRRSKLALMDDGNGGDEEDEDSEDVSEDASNDDLVALDVRLKL